MESTLRTKVLLSVQRALIGEIHSSMRGISVEWADDFIRLHLYIGGEIDQEVMSDFDGSAIGQIQGDFPSSKEGGPRVDYVVVQCDYPQKLPWQGTPVFASIENP
jgi:hypothetical protein